jgi:hypothetical protein
MRGLAGLGVGRYSAEEMPLTDDALTITVLREIRDEIRETRADLGARLDQTNQRLGHLEEAMVELAQQQGFVVRWLKAGTRRDRRIEEDLLKLTTRVDAIEARLPNTEE